MLYTIMYNIKMFVHLSQYRPTSRNIVHMLDNIHVLSDTIQVLY